MAFQLAATVTVFLNTLFFNLLFLNLVFLKLASPGQDLLASITEFMIQEILAIVNKIAEFFTF